MEGGGVEGWRRATHLELDDGLRGDVVSGRLQALQHTAVQRMHAHATTRTTRPRARGARPSVVARRRLYTSRSR